MTKENYTLTKTRSSNIELLKIVAMFLVVVFHFTQTVSSPSEIYPSMNAIDIKSAGTELRNIVLGFMRYVGYAGMNVFFICSAWFLVDSEKESNKRKVLNMLLDVWFVSVIILFAVFFDNKVELNGSTIMRCLLPNTFSNNWYVSVYIILYLLHPAMNKVIRSLTQRKHIAFLLTAFFIYSVWIPLFAEWGASLFLNQIIMWIIVYFAIAYMKHYMTRFSESAKANAIMLAVSTAGVLSGMLIVNYLGMSHPFFNHRNLQFITPQNIFLIGMSVSIFNLFRRLNIHSAFINSVSKLTLFIYIIHENMLLRLYYRPLVYMKLYEANGYTHIILWVLAFSLITFVAATVLAFVYTRTVQKLTLKIGDRLYPFLESKINRALSAIEK